jgi:hypothetical protein
MIQRRIMMVYQRIEISQALAGRALKTDSLLRTYYASTKASEGRSYSFNLLERRKIGLETMVDDNFKRR